MKQGLVRLLYNFGKRFMGWTLLMIMCVLLCYPVSIRVYYQQGVLFLVIPRDQPRASSPINDNYFVNSLQEGLLAGSQTLPQEKTLNFASFHVVKSVPSVPGHSQKRELSPGAADCQISRNYKLKYMNSVSCVTQLSSV